MEWKTTEAFECSIISKQGSVQDFLFLSQKVLLFELLIFIKKAIPEKKKNQYNFKNSAQE